MKTEIKTKENKINNKTEYFILFKEKFEKKFKKDFENFDAVTNARGYLNDINIYILDDFTFIQHLIKIIIQGYESYAGLIQKVARKSAIFFDSYNFYQNFDLKEAKEKAKEVDQDLNEIYFLFLKFANNKKIDNRKLIYFIDKLSYYHNYKLEKIIKYYNKILKEKNDEEETDTEIIGNMYT